MTTKQIMTKSELINVVDHNTDDTSYSTLVKHLLAQDSGKQLTKHELKMQVLRIISEMPE